MAAPAITPSESGVSITRPAPCLANRPSVARNTPPLRPTSSPNTTTRWSRAISSVRAWFTASTTVISAKAVLGETLELSFQPWGSICMNLAEIEIRVGRRLPLRLLPRHSKLVLHLVLHAIQRSLVHNSTRLEMQLHASQGVAVDPQVMKLARLVTGRVIGCGVKSQPVGDCLDECRPLTFAGAPRRLAHRCVHRKQVVAVALDAGEAIGDGFLGQGLRRGLLRDAGRDRPTVVLAEKDDRSLHDPREVCGLVEVTLRCASIAKDRKHDARVLFHLQSPRQAHRLRELARDGGLEGEHLEISRHLEGERVADMPQERKAKRVSVPQLARQLAVLGHEPIGRGVDRHRRPDGGGLLADAWRKR